MRAWARPAVPRLPGHGSAPRLWDTASHSLVEARPLAIANLKLIPVSLLPLGKEIVPTDAPFAGAAA